MEMPAYGAGRGTEDYDRKLREAQEELERIQQQQEELERKKQELEELTTRKRAFVSQQAELTEKLTSAITLIDRELFEMRNETEDLEQCRAVFAGHLDKIQKFTPENWTRDNLPEKLERATLAIDVAADEYDQAAAHFEGGRSGAIFGRAAKRGRNAARRGQTGEFLAQFRNGLAFNLPVIVLGSVALLVYLLK
jgi:Asp-tRNA(Asn)/Glu-tRNA(Gln) amidotransferase B subunit